MSDNGAGRSGTEYDVREYVQEYVYDPIKGSDMCSCSLGERRERVVRCRDCEHCESNGAGDLLCLAHYGSGGTAFFANPDGFCAWGQVRAGSSEVRAGEDE